MYLNGNSVNGPLGTLSVVWYDVESDKHNTAEAEIELHIFIAYLTFPPILQGM